MLSDAQVAVLAYQAGWRGQELITAIAVAQATSHGDETRPGGLWGVGNGDPLTQAAHAYAVWSTSGWGPFPGHSGNAWLLYVPTATAMAAFAAQVGTAAPVVKQVTDDVADAVAGPVQEGLAALRWLENRQTWIRAAKLVAGVGLVLIGVRIAIEATVGPKVAKVAAAVAR